MSNNANPSAAARCDLTDADRFDQQLETRGAHIGVVGLGYAGLPLAVGFADAGFAVTGVDRNSGRVASINRRRSYLPDVSAETLAAFGARLVASDDIGHVSDMAALTIRV